MTPAESAEQAPTPKRSFFRTHWKGLLGYLFGLVFIATVAFCFYLQQEWEKLYVTSCANHFIQHRLAIQSLTGTQPNLCLPHTADTGEALYFIHNTRSSTDESYNDQHLRQWLKSYGAACPESYYGDKSFGYIYVGDGLKLADVEEKKILILFCPAENHRGDQQHCHGYCGGGRYCFKTNEKMAEAIRRAIKQGENGEVAYSERAMNVLREQLQKRTTHVE